MANILFWSDQKTPVIAARAKTEDVVGSEISGRPAEAVPCILHGTCRESLVNLTVWPAYLERWRGTPPATTAT
jgi:hypothetical protein